MKNSATLLSVAGIKIKVHFTFFLLLVFVAVQWGYSNGLSGAVFGLVFTLSLFACVVLHELGHSFTARAYGIPVGQIILLPIGGVSQLSKNPKNPAQEILIALAGPAVSLGLAFLFYSLPGASSAAAQGSFWEDNVQPELSAPAVGFWLFRANLVLAAFNLIPAFPMDGGRVFRASLRLFLKEPRATVIASRVGKAFAVLFGLTGLILGNMVLALVGVFLFFAAQGEASGEITGEVLSHIHADSVCTRHNAGLSTNDTLHQAMKLILGTEQRKFPVFEGEELAGVLDAADLRRPRAAFRPDIPVPLLMDKNFGRVQSNQSLKDVLEELQSSKSKTCAVFEGSRFLGLVDEDRIRLALSLSHLLVSDH
jgi:Zn-dependent protease